MDTAITMPAALGGIGSREDAPVRGDAKDPKPDASAETAPSVPDTAASATSVQAAAKAETDTAKPGQTLQPEREGEPKTALGDKPAVVPVDEPQLAASEPEAEATSAPDSADEPELSVESTSSDEPSDVSSPEPEAGTSSISASDEAGEEPAGPEATQSPEAEDTDEAASPAGAEAEEPDSSADADDETTASAADPEEVSSPAPDANTEVTVVPGVPRYHRAECILIRFMGEDDLDKMPVHAASEAGCTPCRACQPDLPEAEANHLT